MDELCDVYADVGLAEEGIVPGESGAYYLVYVRFVLPLPAAGR